ncbi:Protein of unknown function DUF541 [Thioalkalivibrio nitratireducens DSM 14787]|uniref:SIMPL domain-containing protein n=1 Tax=Thioalkalivibrio nitratireducens (strain DSM 14787 / UNIQEM 213 / ALEN2) TaxID=1255043 RepID=L0DVB5_THIND|nr:SIMPL domain-containing protein [Thioalkalivibrio nitratireducens]AGA32947.1 Protein of unknown function DUF541 [Thioalkalivibrio nitratireducens DSM 14787]
MSRVLLIPTLLAALLAWPPIAGADDGSTLLTVTAQAEGEFDNDRMTVQLRAERRAAEVSEAVADINRRMRAALERLAREPEIDARTLSYSTSPIYDRDRSRTEPVAWQVDQVLELKGGNFELIASIAGELQEHGLAIAQIHFSLSPEKRARHHRELLLEAIRRWQHIAQDMGAAIGASHIVPKALTLHDDGFPGPRPMLALRALDTAESTPALEAGRSTLRVTVSGEARAYGAATLRTLERR